MPLFGFVVPNRNESHAILCQQRLNAPHNGKFILGRERTKNIRAKNGIELLAPNVNVRIMRVIVGHGLNHALQSANRSVIDFGALAATIIQYVPLNGIALHQ